MGPRHRLEVAELPRRSKRIAHQHLCYTFRLGNLERAGSYMESAIDLVPDNRLFKEHLAQIRRARERRE